MSHKAIVCKIEEVVEITGADRIQVAYVLGSSVVVNKSQKVGDVGVFFMPDLQLSVEHCSNNNLFRDSEHNLDKEQKGFFENNRKVRCQPFLKVRSEGFFSPLDCLDWTGYDISKLKVGDSFDELNGKQVCKKYFNEKTLKAMKGNKKLKKKSSVPDFKEHTDTGQYFHNTIKIRKGDLISIQAKAHGTSFRSAHLPVEQKQGWFKKLLSKVFKVKPKYNYEYVTGSRRVILDTPTKEGFHGAESFRFEVTEALKPHLEKGMTVYGEVVGYVNDKPIMSPHKTSALKDKKFKKRYGDIVEYSYGCTRDQYRFIVYRVTQAVGEQQIDLSQSQLVRWCKDRGLEPAMDVCEPFIFDGNIKALNELVTDLTERPDVMTEDYRCHAHPSEGVIVRVDTGKFNPLFLKNKSYVFKVMEGIAKENGVDEEDAS